MLKNKKLVNKKMGYLRRSLTCFHDYEYLKETPNTEIVSFFFKDYIYNFHTENIFIQLNNKFLSSCKI